MEEIIIHAYVRSISAKENNRSLTKLSYRPMDVLIYMYDVSRIRGYRQVYGCVYYAFERIKGSKPSRLPNSCVDTRSRHIAFRVYEKQQEIRRGRKEKEKKRRKKKHRKRTKKQAKRRKKEISFLLKLFSPSPHLPPFLFLSYRTLSQLFFFFPFIPVRMLFCVANILNDF